MADLQRSESNYDIILRDEGLKKKHLIIILNEKINQVKGLENTLERMKTVDFKKIELQKEILEKEIVDLKQELDIKPTVDAEVINQE
jgi:hypothetical protein